MVLTAPVSGCVGVPCLAWYALVSGAACATACAAQAFRVRWSGQRHTGGVYSLRCAPPGQSLNHRKNKKDPPLLHKTTLIRLCKSPKIPKNTKRPLSEPRLCYNQLKVNRVKTRLVGTTTKTSNTSIIGTRSNGLESKGIVDINRSVSRSKRNIRNTS